MQFFWHEGKAKTVQKSKNKFLKVLKELFCEVHLSGCSISTLANKNMFKVDDNKEMELLQLMFTSDLVISLGIFFKSANKVNF